MYKKKKLYSKSGQEATRKIGGGANKRLREPIQIPQIFFLQTIMKKICCLWDAFSGQDCGPLSALCGTLLWSQCKTTRPVHMYGYVLPQS